MKGINYTVCVQCLTYNHSAFIEEALNGFTMQKTSFPFICVILDDASTDGNKEVINRYISHYFDLCNEVHSREETEDYILTFYRHKHNRNCFFVTQFLKYNHYSIKKRKQPYLEMWYDCSQYYCICEGDDYWTDPMKLQKQVDYFNSHSGCGFVYTAYRQQNDVTGESHDVFTSPAIRHDDTFKWELLEQNVIVGTCTTMIDSNLKKQIIEIKDDFQGFIMGDTQTWFNAARLSQIGYIPEVTGVYRKQPTGATATFDVIRRAKFIRGCLDLHLHLAYKYGAPVETIKTIKDKFGVYCLNLYLRQYQYELAEEVNKQYFHGSFLYALSIKVSKLLKLNKLHILGPLHHFEARAGLINMK